MKRVGDGLLCFEKGKDGRSSHPPIIGMPIFFVNRHADARAWHPSEMQLGARLKRARKLRRMSQAALAKAAGVTQPSISELETGETIDIIGETLIGVCLALRVRPAWLVRAIGPMEEQIPQDALQVAVNWLKLVPELRESTAAMLKEMATQSDKLGTPIADEKVEAAFRLPGKPQKTRSRVTR